MTATVTNTGSRAGADVAQLYVSDPAASGQPPRQLEGFARVNLQPGQSQTVSFPLTEQNLRYWNTSTDNWATSTGTYGIAVGDADSTSALTLSGTLAGRGEPARPAGQRHQPGPAGGRGRHRRSRCRSRQPTPRRPDADVQRDRAAGRRCRSRPPARSPARRPPPAPPPSTSPRRTPTAPRPRRLRLDRRRHLGRSPDDAAGRAIRACAWTSPRRTTPTAPPSRSTPATAPTPSSGPRRRTAPSTRWASAWTSPPPAPRTAPLWTCTPATAPARSSGSRSPTERCATRPPAAASTTPAPAAPARRRRSTTAPPQRTSLEVARQAPPSAAPAPARSPATRACAWTYAAPTTRTAPRSRSTPATAPTPSSGPSESNSTLQALGKCLDVNAAGTANGTLVQLYTCNGTVAQVWQPQTNGTLVNPHSGRCLDDTGSGGLRAPSCRSGTARAPRTRSGTALIG